MLCGPKTDGSWSPVTKLAHSYSSIKLFENCPLRYYEQRVTKLIKDEGGEASIHGDRVHKALEARVKNNEALPQDMGGYEPLVNAVTGLVGNGQLLVEQEITINRQMKQVGWWDEDAWLRSKLDVLILKGGGDAIILDWKTGKRRVDMFQFTLYAAQVFLNYPEVDKVKSTLIWLKDQKTDSETFHRKDAPKLWADVLGRITRIEQALAHKTWPARPSGLCPYCPRFKTCDYARK